MGFIQMFRIRSNETSMDRSRRAVACVKRADPDMARFLRYGFLKLPGLRTMARDRGEFTWEKAVILDGSFPV